MDIITSDKKKLENWAKLLLDTGKNNNLINFKDNKTSTLEMVVPSAFELFDEQEEGSVLKVFDPERIISNDSDNDPIYAGSKKAWYIEKYTSLITNKNEVAFYSDFKGSLAVLKEISRRARSTMEETGVNVSYMAFGFIHWKESELATDTYRAPILLVPIKISQATASSPIEITLHKDEAVLNPTFAYKMAEAKIVDLPKFDNESDSNEEQSLQSYFEEVQEAISKLNWTVSYECKVAIFSSQSVNMYADIMENADLVLMNHNVRMLLESQEDELSLSTSGVNQKHYDSVDYEAYGHEGAKFQVLDESDADDASNPLVYLNNVVDADSSQIQAIKMAKSGESFVLQGPPGTGKSQTITNIIAELLSAGKKVLFVSEKMAALNVVYDNLKKVELDQFCLELHSNKSDKKSVITNICRSLKVGLRSGGTKNLFPNSIISVETKQKALEQLDSYANELHKHHSVIDCSLYNLYDEYYKYHDGYDVEFAIPKLPLKSQKYRLDACDLLEQYVQFVKNEIISSNNNFRENVWFGYVNEDNSYAANLQVKSDFEYAIKFLNKLSQVVANLKDYFGITCYDIHIFSALQKLFDFLSQTTLATSSLLDKQNFESVCSKLILLQEMSGNLIALKDELDKVVDDRIYNLDCDLIYKKLDRQFNKLRSRIFNGEYKQLINDLKLCLIENKELSFEAAKDLTKKADEYKQQLLAYQSLESQVKDIVGPIYDGVKTNWTELYQQIDHMNQIVFSDLLDCHDINLGKLNSYGKFDAHKESFLNFSKDLMEVVNLYDQERINRINGYFTPGLLDLLSVPYEKNIARLEVYLSSLDKLNNWCLLRSLIASLEKYELLPFIDKIVEQKLDINGVLKAFNKLFYIQWIDYISSHSQVLALFSRTQHDQSVENFCSNDLKQFDISKNKIIVNLSLQRRSIRDYEHTKPMKIVLHEGEKRKRYKSIRTLLSEAGDIIQRAKPCFLMSPLSVSTYLAPGAVKFDAVIFDEASQIFPQDALGAIYRAKQLIVVGDTKQMPPQNFFKSGASSEDFEDNDINDLSADIKDFESILDISISVMRQVSLRWHYRSRFESLIAFSNKNFYNNDLVTFPSAKSNTYGSGVDFYYLENAVYDSSRTNVAEANKVIDLIYQHIEEFPNRSLGVIAFNSSQQKLIDRLLIDRRLKNANKEFFFNSNTLDSFFIKNLESAQGDERDTIIFSVTYGYNADKRFISNLGPLNRQGGERRLNVAFTRAKYNIKLVSSITAADIDLSRSKSEGMRLLREYLEYAQKGTASLNNVVDNEHYERYDFTFEQQVCNFLKSQGYIIDNQIGCSEFKVDIGVKLDNSSDYILAIECDGNTYRSANNTRDRDRLRKAVLNQMGWQYYRVWSTSWFKDPALEKKLLLAAVNNAIELYKQSVKELEEKKKLAEQAKAAKAAQASVNQPLPVNANAAQASANQPLPVNAAQISANQQLPVNAAQVSANQPLPTNAAKVSVNQPLPVNAAQASANQPLPVNAAQASANQPLPANAAQVSVNQPLPANAAQAGANQSLPVNANAKEAVFANKLVATVDAGSSSNEVPLPQSNSALSSFTFNNVNEHNKVDTPYDIAQKQQIAEFFKFKEAQEKALLANKEQQPAAIEADNSAKKVNNSEKQVVAFDSVFEQEVYEFLSSKGFDVHTQVTCLGYRIDLAIKDLESKKYVLAIECDGASYHSSAHAQKNDYLRQIRIEQKGWKFYRIWSTNWFNDKEKQKQLLLDAVKQALADHKDQLDEKEKSSSATVAKTSSSTVSSSSLAKASTTNQSTVVTHEATAKQQYVLEEYQMYDLQKLSNNYMPMRFMKMLSVVLEKEAPLSEEFFLKRFVWYFDGRKKVTSSVRDKFNAMMRPAKNNGIIRENGFLSLKDGPKVKFRKAGYSKREVKYISPEELMLGLFYVIKTKGNDSANINGMEGIIMGIDDLYHELGLLCGVNRIGGDIKKSFDEALTLARTKKYLIVRGNNVILKKVVKH